MRHNNKTQIVINDKFSYLDYVCVKLCKSKSSKRIDNYKNFLLLHSSFQEKMNIVTYFKLFNQVTLLSKAPILAEYINDAQKNMKINISEVDSSHKKILLNPEIKIQTELLKLRDKKNIIK